jgi:PAS domain S-box-containing protein
LPLVLTVILAIPVAVIQIDASNAVTRASHADALGALARKVEEAALDVGTAGRKLVPDSNSSQARYVRSVAGLHESVVRLEGAVNSEKGRTMVNTVGKTVDAYLRAIYASILRSERTSPHKAVGTLGSGAYADRLRRSTIIFDDRVQENELQALTALGSMWRFSLAFLTVTVAGLTICSLFLLHYSGKAVDGILELGRKADRYRRGVPLGEASPRRDEIGQLDRAVHEFGADLQQRERLLKRYRLLSEVTHDIILFIDRGDLTIIDANAAALATYGYPNLIGQATQILHAADETFNDDMVALSDRPEGLSYEALHQRADGTTFPVEVYMHTALVEGRPTIIKTIRDISERRFAAEQVALALDRALEASQVKSEFVATMSHEIRTPMHGVIGMSELLLETQLMPLQREYASTVKESAQALLTIIDDILDFSKLEANKMELEVVAFDPYQLIAGALNLVRGTARERGLTLRSYVSSHVPTAVSGDPTRLRQVLVNLIGNAVKFTAAGEVSVTTSVERDDGEALVLAFAVSDTGIGVAPQARARLFEAFVQADGSTTRRFGGSGLGLSICRQLVELMGGRIWLGDHQGPGATFCFAVPFQRTGEVAVPVALAAGALRVLVLDDDKATRKTFAAMLTAWGMHNESSADIESARTQLREAAQNGSPFDVVLIDYVLPLSDGLEFAVEVGENKPEYGSPARILVTAFDADGRKAAALAAGCAAYLPKPIDPSVLYDALGGIDRERRMNAAALVNGRHQVRILMAEDSALIRRVAHFQLAELQYGVDIVENGLQAVAAVATGEYELVLMDMRMPEMNGLDATRAIREAERSSGNHVVVVALTANVLEGDRKACIDAGMDDFLAKPLKLDDLRVVLERWLPALV